MFSAGYEKSPMPQHGDDFLMRNTDSPDWHPMPVFCDFISLQAVPVIVKKKSGAPEALPSALSPTLPLRGNFVRFGTECAVPFHSSVSFLDFIISYFQSKSK